MKLTPARIETLLEGDDDHSEVWISWGDNNGYGIQIFYNEQYKDMNLTPDKTYGVSFDLDSLPEVKDKIEILPVMKCLYGCIADDPDAVLYQGSTYKYKDHVFGARPMSRQDLKLVLEAAAQNYGISGVKLWFED